MLKIIIFIFITYTSLFSDFKATNYEEYFKNNRNIMLFIDPANGSIVKANQSASNFYGYSIKELQKMSIKDFNTFTKQQVQEEMKKAKEQKRNYFLFSHKLANGNIVKVRVFSSPIHIDGKNLLYSTIYPLILEEEFLDHFNETLEEQVRLQTKEIKENETKIRQFYLIGFVLLGVALFIAITNLIQRNRLAKELARSNERFSLAMESTRDGLWDWNPVTNEVYFNKTLKSMLGYSDDEMQNSFGSWHSKLHPEDYDRVMEALNSHVKAKTSLYESIYRLKHKDGSWVWIFARGKALFDEYGNATRVLGFHTDISKQKELSKEIETQQIKYQTIMQNSSDAIFIIDLKGYIIEYSKQFKEMLGYKDEELLKLHISEYEAIHSKEKIKRNIENTKYSPIFFQSKYKKSDGTLIDVSLNIVRMKLDDKEYIYTSCRDITKQNQLQLEVLKQKLEYETIFDYAQDGIALVDLDLNFLNCNKAFLDMTGYTKEEVLSKNCQELTADEFKAINEEAVREAIEKGHVENIEKSCVVADEKRLTVNMSISLLPDEKRLLILLHDTTVLKLMEHQARLASMGEMIGNIAHQWRQPLSIISTAASGVNFRLNFENKIDNEEIKRVTKNIVKQTKYLSKTIDDFKNFVKGDKSEKLLSVKDTITDVINLTKATIDNNYIKLIIDIEDDVTLFGNKSELEQALINIINNAKDSLNEHISNDDDKLLFITTKNKDKNQLVLKILDSGGGIPVDIIHRIFEPYFTTKHKSLGTGIGLSMVNKIISERHGAKIEVFNEEYKYNEKNYKGASFNIVFEDKN